MATSLSTRQTFYVDTRAGFPGLFSPPPGVKDYAAWLREQMKISQHHSDGFCYGLAQKVNEMAFASSSRGVSTTLVFIGEGELAARAFLAEQGVLPESEEITA